MITTNAIRKAGAALVIAATAALPLALSSPATAQGAAPAGCTGKTKTGIWLNVVAEGIKSSKGLLAITIYEDKRKKFLAKGGAYHVARIKAKAGSTRGCVFLPKTGVYVIALYHDIDADQKFDRTGLGLPAEAYGFSNNPSTLAGLPSFRSVRLNVSKANLTTRIRMKYP